MHARRHDPPSATPAGSREGFHFTDYMRRVCHGLIEHTAELRHIDLRRVGIGFCQTRNRSQFGVHATLTPLRFAGGQCQTVRRGRTYRIQRVLDAEGTELLYLLNFYLPRFLDLEFSEKLATTVHELWHIGPAFDGDMRRFAGRCYAHSGSRKAFDDHAAALANRWLKAHGEANVAELRYNFAQMQKRHGRIFGHRYRLPRLLPVE